VTLSGKGEHSSIIEPDKFIGEATTQLTAPVDKSKLVVTTHATILKT